MDMRNMTDVQFIALMKTMLNDAVIPVMRDEIKDEVNRQMKTLTATLVAGLVQR